MIDNGDELLPVVNDKGEIIGSTTRKECHNYSFILHPVVHLHLFNNKGELYLQKRPIWKEIQPGKWDTAVGGHVDYGESIDDALRREINEELGISNIECIALTPYIFTSAVERELVYPFYAIYDGIINPTEETDGGRFWSISETEANIGNDVFTPNFEQEYLRLQLSEIQSNK